MNPNNNKIVENEIDIKKYQRTVKQIFLREYANLHPQPILQRSIELPASKEIKTPEYPPLVQVGISTVCNMRCPQCYYPRFQQSPEFSPIFMNPIIYDKIIDEVENFPESTMLRFLGRGESLTHPHVVNMVKKAKEKIKGKVVLITNGLLMDKRKARQILETGIDVVDFSVDAITPETYTRVRGGNFEQLTQNLGNFITTRNQEGYSTRIITSFLLQPENYHEAEEFRRTWDSRVDKVIFRKYHSYAGKIKEKPWISEERHPCAALWNRVNINETGKMTLCYIDWDETSIIADLNEPNTTILDTWRGSYDEARKGHQAGNYPDICSKCKTGWQAAHWQLSYEQAVKMVTTK